LVKESELVMRALMSIHVAAVAAAFVIATSANSRTRLPYLIACD
jgi:hypothetical protein